MSAINEWPVSKNDPHPATTNEAREQKAEGKRDHPQLERSWVWGEVETLNQKHQGDEAGIERLIVQAGEDSKEFTLMDFAKEFRDMEERRGTPWEHHKSAIESSEKAQREEDMPWLRDE